MKGPLRVNEAALKRLSPAKQKEIRETLQAAENALKRNPLSTYVPFPKQDQFHSSPARTRLYVGGNRAGKSTAGVADDLIQALPLEFVPPHLLKYKKFGHDEPCKVRVVTPDLGYTMEVVINKFRELTPREALINGHWGQGSWDKTHRVLRFQNGSTVDFMSTDQDPDKFGGVDLHRVHYDEEPSGTDAEVIWQELRWRLLDHGGDILLTMTPLFGVSTLVHDKVWKRRNESGVFAVQASVWDNPTISKAEIEEAMEDMTEEEIRARVHGEFVHFAGRFYDEFGEDTHVREPLPPADIQQMDVIVGIDPGLKRTAVVWVAFDDDNAAVVFAELYEHDEVPTDIAPKIKAMNLKWGIDPLYFVIDPAARVRDQINREQIQSAYAREGIATIFGQNERGPGILEVKRRLQAKSPSLVVTRDCPNLIYEFPLYRKDPKANDEFAAIKTDDHALDALRYVCMERPWGPHRDLPDENFRWTPGTAPPWHQLERAAPGGSGPPLGDMT